MNEADFGRFRKAFRQYENALTRHSRACNTFDDSLDKLTAVKRRGIHNDGEILEAAYLVKRKLRAHNRAAESMRTAESIRDVIISNEGSGNDVGASG